MLPKPKVGSSRSYWDVLHHICRQTKQFFTLPVKKLKKAPSIYSTPQTTGLGGENLPIIFVSTTPHHQIRTKLVDCIVNYRWQERSKLQVWGTWVNIQVLVSQIFRDLFRFIPVYSGYSGILFRIFRDFFKGNCVHLGTHFLKKKLKDKCTKMTWLVPKWNVDHLKKIPQPEILTRSGFQKINVP